MVYMICVGIESFTICVLFAKPYTLQALSEYPTLTSWMKRVAELPRVAEYLASRPTQDKLGRNVLPKP